MHDDLWAGVLLKLDHGSFHLDQMGRSIQPPERTHLNVALEASGAIIDTGWQRSFYAYFDAFLSATRSIPEILQCCFGYDRDNRMKMWFDALPPDEQQRRHDFTARFEPALQTFRALHLGKARHRSQHRRGFAQVDVEISDWFGVMHAGGSIERLPSARSRQIDDPNLAFLARPTPLRPTWTDFTINGLPLFEECTKYLEAAKSLVDDARKVVDSVHGNDNLTEPR
jgi:hypothetical protein